MKIVIKIHGFVVSYHPETKEQVVSKMQHLGHISKTGVFHFSADVPKYIKTAAIEQYLSKIEFLTGIANTVKPV